MSPPCHAQHTTCLIGPDASAILEIPLRTPNDRALEDRLLDDNETLHAPRLLDLEVAQVLRRYVMRGRGAKLAAACGHRARIELL